MTLPLALREGLALYQEERWQDAGDTLAKALQMHRGLPIARQVLARLFLRMGNLTRALEAAEAAVRYEPDVASAWLTLAEMQKANGRAAAASMKRAAELSVEK